jgi:hypothetical protein
MASGMQEPSKGHANNLASHALQGTPLTSFSAGLKIDPGPQQHVAGRERRCYLSEAPILQVGVEAAGISRRNQVNAIEQVEEVDAEFQVDPFGDRSDLLDREVGIGIPRIAKAVRGLISLLPH